MNNKKKNDTKNRIIERQIIKIETLKKDISKLEIDVKEKAFLHDEFLDVIEDLKKQREEYNKLINELQEMKNTMNEIVFKKRWKLIKFLMK